MQVDHVAGDRAFYRQPSSLHLHQRGVSWCVVPDDRVSGGGKDANAGSIRVSVSFNAADYGEIKGIARAQRVSAAWVVRDAVTHYLNSRTPLFTGDRSGPGR